MARREDIDLLRQKADTDDLETLESVHKQLQEIISNLNINLSSSKDEDIRNLLLELRDEATCTDEDVTRRLAEIKVDMLDPAYEQRKAERDRKKLEKQRQNEMWQQKLATEGLGGLFKGFGEVFGGKQPDAVGGAAPATASVQCAGCHAPVSPAAKFCPECGQPVPQEKRCSQCSLQLQPNARFCPECGTRAS